MNLILQRYQICIAVVKVFLNFFLHGEGNFFNREGDFIFCEGDSFLPSPWRVFLTVLQSYSSVPKSSNRKGLVKRR